MWQRRVTPDVVPRTINDHLAQLVSTLADTLHSIALVVQMTGQGATVVVRVAAEVIPTLFLSPTASVVMDRFSIRAVVKSRLGWSRRCSGRRGNGTPTWSWQVSPRAASS